MIDESWIQVLHLAFKEHWQFGRDVVFSFGPWGFLYGGYSPETQTAATISWIGLAFVFWWVGWRVARHLFEQVALAWLWFILLVGTTGVTPYLNMDVRLAAWILLLWMQHYFVDNRTFSGTQALLTTVIGWLSLVKCSIGVFAVVVIFGIALDNMLRHRRFPWLLVVYGTSLLIFWCLAGQRLGSVLPFFVNSVRVTNGYTDAMGRNGPDELLSVLWFLGAAALIAGLAGYACWKRWKLFGSTAMVGFAFLLFTAFKYGFVRNGAHHVSSYQELFLAALGSAAVSWPVVRNRGRRVIMAWLFPLLLVGALTSRTFREYLPDGLLSDYAATLSPAKLLAPAKWFGGREALLRAHQTRTTEIARLNPLPQPIGSVDIYPWNQAALLAHGLRYSPRPVFQSYQAYTPELAALNAAHLWSDHAADYVLFQVKPIDNRFAALEDSLSWPELLTRYDVQALDEDVLVLKHSTVPRSFHQILLGEVTARFGEPLTVPPAVDNPIWSEIEIRPTAVGRLASVFYRPPLISILVSLRNGTNIESRLVPGMARGGFLLSPLIQDEASFARLAATNGLAQLSDEGVTSITITGESSGSITSCYQNDIRVRFYRLDYPRQNFELLDFKVTPTGK